MGYNRGMIRTLILVVVGFFLVLKGVPQRVEWSRLYIQPSARAFLPQVATVDSQSNLIVAGRIILTGGHYSVALFKYDPNGNLLWSATFGVSNQSELAEAIAVAPDDSLYLAVTRANTDSIAFLQRWSPAGTLLWSTEINLSAYDVVRELLVRPDGAVEVLHAYGSGGIGFARLIYDSNGNLRASHTFPAPNTMLANRTPVGIVPVDATRTMLIVQDPELNEVLHAFTTTRLMVLNSAGSVLSEQVLPLRTTRYAKANDGTLYLLGDYWNSSAGQMRLRVCRVDSNGTLLNQWEVPTADGDAIPDVLLVSGNVWLASGGVEGESARGSATEIRTNTGTSLASQALVGAYRPVSGVALGGLFVQLMGVLEDSPTRWKPFLQWWRTNGSLLGTTFLPPTSSKDEQPEMLLRAPDGALYAIATVNRDSDNIAGAGIWRLRLPPSLSGRVILESFVGNPATRTAEFTLTSGSQTETLSVPLGTNSEYQLYTVFTGTVEVRVVVPGFLARRQTLNLTDNLVVDWELINGDANRDNRVDDADLLTVLFAFGQTGSLDADLNGDGRVDDADLLIVLFNFGAVGD